MEAASWNRVYAGWMKTEVTGLLREGRQLRVRYQEPRGPGEWAELDRGACNGRWSIARHEAGLEGA